MRWSYFTSLHLFCFLIFALEVEAIPARHRYDLRPRPAAAAVLTHPGRKGAKNPDFIHSKIFRDSNTRKTAKYHHQGPLPGPLSSLEADHKLELQMVTSVLMYNGYTASQFLKKRNCVKAVKRHLNHQNNLALITSEINMQKKNSSDQPTSAKPP